MENSRLKPWYGCTTKETIQKDADARYYESGAGDVSGVLCQLMGLKYRHTSTHNGYIPRNDSALLPYSGKFGEGFIYVTYHSPFRVLYKYFIMEGEKHGKRH